MLSIISEIKYYNIVFQLGESEICWGGVRQWEPQSCYIHPARLPRGSYTRQLSKHSQLQFDYPCKPATLVMYRNISSPHGHYLGACSCRY